MNKSQERQRTDQYVKHLGHRVRYTKGWDLTTLKPQGKPMMIRLTCIHGRKYREEFHPQALADAPNVKGVADQHYRRAIKWCKGEHVDLQIKPWYSTPKPSPWSTITWTSPIVMPKYEYDIDPCPVCQQPVNSLIVNFGMGGAGVVQIPCGCAVSCNNVTYTNVGSNVIKIKATLTAGAPAGMGIGSMSGHPTVNALLKVCPGLKKASASCPDCTVSGPLTGLIPHINDTHKWTRERIANWLDTLPFDLSIKPPTEGNENGNDSIGSKTAIAATGDFGNTDALALAKEYGKYLQSAPGID